MKCGRNFTSCPGHNSMWMQLNVMPRTCQVAEQTVIHPLLYSTYSNLPFLTAGCHGYGSYIWSHPPHHANSTPSVYSCIWSRPPYHANSTPSVLMYMEPSTISRQLYTFSTHVYGAVHHITPTLNRQKSYLWSRPQYHALSTPFVLVWSCPQNNTTSTPSDIRWWNHCKAFYHSARPLYACCTCLYNFSSFSSLNKSPAIAVGRTRLGLFYGT